MTGTVPTVDQIREAFDRDAALREERDAALARAERAEQEREHYKSDAVMYRSELDAALARAEMLTMERDGVRKAAQDHYDIRLEIERDYKSALARAEAAEKAHVASWDAAQKLAEERDAALARAEAAEKRAAELEPCRDNSEWHALVDQRDKYRADWIKAEDDVTKFIEERDVARGLYNEKRDEVRALLNQRDAALRRIAELEAKK